MNVHFYWTELDAIDFSVFHCRSLPELHGAILACNPQLVYLVEVGGNILVSEYMEIILPFVENTLGLLPKGFGSVDVCLIEFNDYQSAYQMATMYKTNPIANA